MNPDAGKKGMRSSFFTFLQRGEENVTTLLLDTMGRGGGGGGLLILILQPQLITPPLLYLLFKTRGSNP
jgi:hypothetical protein